MMNLKRADVCFERLVTKKNNKKKNPGRRDVKETDGGDKGSRTPDLLNAIETLYQLSYIPKKENARSLSK